MIKDPAWMRLDFEEKPEAREANLGNIEPC